MKAGCAELTITISFQTNTEISKDPLKIISAEIFLLSQYGVL